MISLCQTEEWWPALSQLVDLVKPKPKGGDSLGLTRKSLDDMSPAFQVKFFLGQAENLISNQQDREATKMINQAKASLGVCKADPNTSANIDDLERRIEKISVLKKLIEPV